MKDNHNYNCLVPDYRKPKPYWINCEALGLNLIPRSWVTGHSWTGSRTINFQPLEYVNIVTILKLIFLTKYYYCYKAVICSLYVLGCLPSRWIPLMWEIQAKLSSAQSRRAVTMNRCNVHDCIKLRGGFSQLSFMYVLFSADWKQNQNSFLRRWVYCHIYIYIYIYHIIQK